MVIGEPGNGSSRFVRADRFIFQAGARGLLQSTNRPTRAGPASRFVPVSRIRGMRVGETASQFSSPRLPEEAAAGDRWRMGEATK